MALSPGPHAVCLLAIVDPPLLESFSIEACLSPDLPFP